MVMNRRRLAAALWIVWAVIVWNVVFDRVLVEAGREYVRSALAAADGSGPYARIDDRMRPALSRALGAASAAAGVIVVVGLVAFRLAARRATSAEHFQKT
jgi:ABC-type Fe3+ transport system permease subunit